MDIVKLVSTIKTLLYAGNSWINSPLALIALGTIYLFHYTLTGQSAENFKFSTKTTVSAKNTYNNFTNLLTISINVNNLSYYIINQIRYYTTAVKTPPSCLLPPKGGHRQEINPNFITGLIDGEGCFFIRIRKNPKSKIGWNVEPKFVITLHPKDTAILNLLKIYFGEVGNISHSKNSVSFWVSSLKELNDKILPHFLNYYLLTQKKADFLLFKNIIDLMKNKEHLTLEGLKKFVAFKASINLGLSELLLNEFSDIIAIERPLIKNQIINNPYWLAGFVSEEGCFQVNIFNSTNKIGQTVRLFFTITQNFRDEALMNTLINYLGCGTLYKNQTKNSVDYKVTKINDLIEKIIPFFEKYKLLGIKTHDFEDFKKIALLIKNGDHLTNEGFYIISGLKSGMNKKRELKTSAIRAEKNKKLASHSSILNCNNSFLNKRSYCTLNKISEHVPKHKSDFTDNEFGHFLAGLIEGDGWFGNKELHIIFSIDDSSLAYLIKKRIGHGNIYKNKKAVRYICKNQKGLSIILSLINGKLISHYKYEQLITNNSNHKYSEYFNIKILPPLKNLSLNNYWLAGFTQADGCFHISVAKSKTHKTGYSVRLEYSLKQNDCLPLKLLYDYLKKGNLSQYSTGIWCYKSSGFSTASDLINYFDKYHLFGGKYVSYLKFRKVYIMITEGKHLDKKGIDKIISISTKGFSETSTQGI